MALQLFPKDPDSKLNYTMDWVDWLATGETISTSTWVVPAGITQEGTSTNDNTTATIVVSGGTVGVQYPLVNRITTSASRTVDRTIIVLIVER